MWQFTHNPIAMMRPTNQIMSSVELQRPPVYCAGLHRGAATITLSLVLTVISLWTLYTGSTSLAHPFAIFPHSLDVEIDDNLVGQLSFIPQLHLVLDFHFATCTFLSLWVVQCALCGVCTVCTVCTMQVTGSGEGAGDNQTITVTQLQLFFAPNLHHAKISSPKMGNQRKQTFLCVCLGGGAFQLPGVIMWGLSSYCCVIHRCYTAEQRLIYTDNQNLRRYVCITSTCNEAGRWAESASSIGFFFVPQEIE